MQVALSLYVHLGKHLLLQLEAFVSLLLARLGDARGGAHATELQEVALEVPCPCACHNLCVTSAHATTTAAHPDWPVPAIWSCWNACHLVVLEWNRAASLHGCISQAVHTRWHTAAWPELDNAPTLTILLIPQPLKRYATTGTGPAGPVQSAGLCEGCVRESGLPHRAQQPV